MKHKLKRFLKLRKQSDGIKILSLFVLVAIACFIHMLIQVWEIYRMWI